MWASLRIRFYSVRQLYSEQDELKWKCFPSLWQKITSWNQNLLYVTDPTLTSCVFLHNPVGYEHILTDLKPGIKQDLGRKKRSLEGEMIWHEQKKKLSTQPIVWQISTLLSTLKACTCRCQHQHSNSHMIAFVCYAGIVFLWIILLLEHASIFYISPNTTEEYGNVPSFSCAVYSQTKVVKKFKSWLYDGCRWAVLKMGSMQHVFTSVISTVYLDYSCVIQMHEVYPDRQITTTQTVACMSGLHITNHQ